MGFIQDRGDRGLRCPWSTGDDNADVLDSASDEGGTGVDKGARLATPEVKPAARMRVEILIYMLNSSR